MERFSMAGRSNTVVILHVQEEVKMEKLSVARKRLKMEKVSNARKK